MAAISLYDYTSTADVLTLTIDVKNLVYQKCVFARFTFNAWETFGDIQAAWYRSTEDLERDLFRLKVPWPENSAVAEFATCCMQGGGTWWDNNETKNHTVLRPGRGLAGDSEDATGTGGQDVANEEASVTAEESAADEDEPCASPPASASEAVSSLEEHGASSPQEIGVSTEENSPESQHSGDISTSVDVPEDIPATEERATDEGATCASTPASTPEAVSSHEEHGASSPSEMTVQPPRKRKKSRMRRFLSVFKIFRRKK